MKAAIAEWCNVHVLRDGTHVVHDGVWNATGNSKVVAWDSSNVEARGNSKVEAWGSSTIILLTYWPTNKLVQLHDEAICINHSTHTIKSAIKWKVEENE